LTQANVRKSVNEVHEARSLMVGLGDAFRQAALQSVAPVPGPASARPEPLASAAKPAPMFAAADLGGGGRFSVRA
jgi:hypothetical protein